MRMFGIDPGLTATGWGVVSLSSGRLTYHDHGVIKSSPRMADEKRLHQIYTQLVAAMQKAQPDAVSIEEIFVVKNPRSALRLGMARGAGLVAAAEHGLEVSEIAARRVKQVLTGTGAADKDQVAFMVSTLLNIEMKAGDAADALAIAIAALQGGASPLSTSGQAGDISLKSRGRTDYSMDGAPAALRDAVAAALAKSDPPAEQ